MSSEAGEIHEGLKGEGEVSTVRVRDIDPDEQERLKELQEGRKVEMQVCYLSKLLHKRFIKRMYVFSQRVFPETFFFKCYSQGPK